MRVSAAVLAVLGCWSRRPGRLRHARTTRRWSTHRSRATPTTPTTAAPVPPDPRVGAVFLGGGDLHTCTGGVLDSTARRSDPHRRALRGRGRRRHVRRRASRTPPTRRRLADRRRSISTRDGCRTRIRWPTSRSRGSAATRGGTVEAQAGGGLTLGAGPETGHRRHRDRIRAGRRRRPDRLHGGHGTGAGRLPVAALRRAGRRNQSGAPWTTGRRSPD